MINHRLKQNLFTILVASTSNLDYCSTTSATQVPPDIICSNLPVVIQLKLRFLSLGVVLFS